MEAPTVTSVPTTAVCPLSASASNTGSCDAIAVKIQAIAAQKPWLKSIIRFPLFRAIAECAYGTISWNHGYFRLPSRNYDALPDTSEMPFHFRLSYFCLSTVIACALTFVFGVSLTAFFPEFAWWEAGLNMLLIAGAGWLLQAFIVILTMRKNTSEYLSNLATIMWQGTLPLLPAAMITLLGFPIAGISAAAVGISSILMFRQHFVRVNFLQMSQGWTFLWLLSLQSTAWLAIYFILPSTF